MRSFLYWALSVLLAISLVFLLKFISFVNCLFANEKEIQFFQDWVSRKVDCKIKSIELTFHKINQVVVISDDDRLAILADYIRSAKIDSNITKTVFLPTMEMAINFSNGIQVPILTQIARHESIITFTYPIISYSDSDFYVLRFENRSISPKIIDLYHNTLGVCAKVK
ncbi:hypothetical protein [Tuwongella immobilis]|uniref:hypothetical protein n=1 Tax=Tuwongella immobilis TaxID=692036 RepID=UPI0013A69B5D|nr:hypothetical protein [Tuwongella immobilis]